MSDKTHATIRLAEPAKWSKKGRKEIALWLRRCGESLMKQGHKYSRGFTFRYFSVPKKK